MTTGSGATSPHRSARRRIRSTQSIKKITRAMELIAASRVVKARQRVAQTTPYANAITRAVSAVASYADVDHPLTTERETVRRAGVLIISSDRGLAGAYSGNVMKRSEQLRELLEEDEGKEMVPYLTGRKAEGYYRFRGRDFEQSWSGFSDAPTFEVAREIAQRLTADFIAGSENGGVDELHIVSTRFVNMVTQEVQVVRLLPLEVVEDEAPVADEDIYPLYEFEPDGAQVLDALRSRGVDAVAVDGIAAPLHSRMPGDVLPEPGARVATWAAKGELTCLMYQRSADLGYRPARPDAHRATRALRGTPRSGALPARPADRR